MPLDGATAVEPQPLDKNYRSAYELYKACYVGAVVGIGNEVKVVNEGECDDLILAHKEDYDQT